MLLLVAGCVARRVRSDETKDTVTLRHRDSMRQERIKIADLLAKLRAGIRKVERDLRAR